jgi:uncharacterized protein YbjT (DUF2867 family)
LAGATGVLGRQVLAELAGKGIPVRAMGRDAAQLAKLGAAQTFPADLLAPDSVRGACDGVDAVVSCAGAPLSLDWSDREGFHRVDFLGHLPLIEDAVRHRVRKFVYVSLAGAMALRETEYAQSHERTVATLAESGLNYSVVRPTGLFHFYLEFLRMAARGLILLPGNGGAKTNPIHEADAARACVAALDSDNTQIIAGGPEVFTRRRIAEIAFESLGRTPRVFRGPPILFAPLVPALRIPHRRLAAIVEFGIAVSGVDCVAPSYGTRRLGEYLRSAAQQAR